MPETTLVPLIELHPWPDNPRVVFDQAFRRLQAQMLADTGMLWLRPLGARMQDGLVYAGSVRLLAAQDLARSNRWPLNTAGNGSFNAIPCQLEELTMEQAAARALRDNTHAGAWDQQLLGELVYSLDALDVDLDALGFSAWELTRILDEVAGDEHFTPLPDREMHAPNPQQEALLEPVPGQTTTAADTAPTTATATSPYRPEAAQGATSTPDAGYRQPPLESSDCEHRCPCCNQYLPGPCNA